MNNTGEKSDARILRQWAEALLIRKSISGARLSEDDFRKLIHALEVHRVELEIQNEELVKAKTAAQEATEKYMKLYNELYDFEPSGYFTLSKNGKILELNLSAAKMLGSERSLLKDSMFGYFITGESRPVFDNFLDRVVNSEAKQTCEVTFLTGDNLPMYFYLTGRAMPDGEECLVNAVDISERKRIEESLKTSEDKLRFILNNSTDCIYQFNLRTNRYEYVSQSVEKVLGFSSGELEGLEFEKAMAMVHPDDVTGVRKALSQVEESGQSVVEYRQQTKNGDYKWISNYMNLTVDKDGAPLYRNGSLRDVTKRKQIEKTLRESEQRFRLIAEQLSIGIAIAKISDDRFIYMNPGCIEILGLKPGEFTEHVASEFYYDPVDRDKCILTLMKQGFIKDRNIKYRRIDGTAFWASSTMQFIDYFGEQAILGTYIDINERIQAEEALQKIKGKLELALSKGNVGVWEIDLKTQRLNMDRRMEKMFGFEAGAFKGTLVAFENCLIEEDIPHTREAIKRALEEDVPINTIYRIKSSKGNINYINAKGQVVRDEEGNAYELTGVCFDITDIKEGADEALFKLNDELLRSNKELEQFAYVASHDLQEPLRTVSTFTLLLAQRYTDQLDESAQQFIKFVVEAAVRSKELINDLLNYSRIGTRPQKYSKIDFKSVMEITLKNLYDKINEKNAVVTYDLLPSVLGDEESLVHLMQNLVVNAIKFCENIPRIHISSQEEPDHYVFSVKDNGIGIDRKYSDRIFLIFQRLVSRYEYEGSGIGLAVCKRIVERHGGKIWFESNTGPGTTFYFTISKKARVY